MLILDFFHGVANGRRRKCSILSLDIEEGGISEPVELRKHIEGYYKFLFGSEERGSMRLQEEMWRVWVIVSGGGR
jgi:hypothetical protein